MDDMVEVALAVALLLLAGGVLGSVLPVLPSGVLSLAGVVVYAAIGARPLDPLLLASMAGAGLAAAALEVLAGPMAARASGASNRTTLAATVTGVALFFVAGPLGLLLGLVGGVLLVELWRGTDAGTASRRAAVTAVGLFGAAVFQLLLTGSVLLAFLVAVFLL